MDSHEPHTPVHAQDTGDDSPDPVHAESANGTEPEPQVTEDVHEAPTAPPPAQPEAYFVSREREMHYRHPVDIVTASAPKDVLPALERIAAAVEAGNHAAGYIAYEAAGAFDAALKTHAPAASLPLVWFAIFPPPEQSIPRQHAAQPFQVGDWHASLAPDEYRQSVERIRGLIGDGETYQVNFTFPMHAAFSGDALSWFRTLCNAQKADFCAYISTGPHDVLSISPELFFRLDGETLTVRPMKGTRPRGLWPEADAAAAQELAASEKEQAENVMIVDLMRNDLGRVCDAGSIQVTRLYDVERYETVWQMTSTIEGKTRASIPEILRALFPSGSVTGAPKIHTMEIIQQVERCPRGVYCGAVGWIAPNRQAEFNVAIRTVTIDKEQGTAHYHVGGGVTWDSTAEHEYDECIAKSALLTHKGGDFSLLETLHYDGAFYLLDRHLARMEASAHYFGFPFQSDRVKADLFARAAAWTVTGMSPLRVRLLLSRSGALQVEASSAPRPAAITLGYARDPVDTGNVFLYHKTTRREFYETACCTRPDCDDVLLWNTRDEITESTIANVVLEIEGERLTPPVACGLLPGVMRAELLAHGQIRESVLTKADVERATNIWLINSVRRWSPVIWRG